MQTLTAPEIGLNSTKQRKQKTRKELRTRDDKGNISAYGFACGEVQREKNEANGHWKEMYREHNTFHVRALALNGPLADGKPWNVWESWEVAGDNLTTARKFYNSLNI